jgi:hypothetical protein
VITQQQQQQQQQQITLPTLQPLHHKDTGQQGVALLASLPPAKTLPTTSDLVPPTIRKSDTHIDTFPHTFFQLQD